MLRPASPALAVRTTATACRDGVAYGVCVRKTR
jgi:hypothetical protein